MKHGKIRIWLPSIRAGTGADVFTMRLAAALERCGMIATIDWFRLGFEAMPLLLRGVRPPDGTDIILANSWNGLAFRRAGLPLIVTVHHAAFASPHARQRSLARTIYHRLLIGPFERRSLRTADAVTAVSGFAARSLQRVIGDRHVDVLHNWVDIGRYAPPPARQDGPRPFRLLFVGKPTWLKGVDMLAPVMRRLGAGFELAVAANLKPGSIADQPRNIHVLGWLGEKDMIQAYRHCDALLFPSRSEGFGYAALEAMACGKPVIASNATALPEVVSDGVTGMLCPVGDAAAFASACERLAADPALCQAMGNAGRARAVARFSEAAIIPGYIELIHRLLRR